MTRTVFPAVVRLTLSVSTLCALAACNSNGPTATMVPNATNTTTGSSAPITAPTSSTPGSTGMPAAGSAIVTWVAPTQNADGSALTNLAGFHVYFGTDRNVLSTLQDVPRAGAGSAEVLSLKAGTYFFAVSAYTADGTESELSTVVSKQVS